MISVGEIVQIGIYLFALVVLTPVLGRYMAIVFSGEIKIFLFGKIESFLYNLIGVSSKQERTGSDIQAHSSCLMFLDFFCCLFCN